MQNMKKKGEECEHLPYKAVFWVSFTASTMYLAETLVFNPTLRRVFPYLVVNKSGSTIILETKPRKQERLDLVTQSFYLRSSGSRWSRP
jgi:hypothetical protein